MSTVKTSPAVHLTTILLLPVLGVGCSKPNQFGATIAPQADRGARYTPEHIWFNREDHMFNLLARNGRLENRTPLPKPVGIHQPRRKERQKQQAQRHIRQMALAFPTRRQVALDAPAAILMLHRHQIKKDKPEDDRSDPAAWNRALSSIKKRD